MERFGLGFRFMFGGEVEVEVQVWIAGMHVAKRLPF